MQGRLSFVVGAADAAGTSTACSAIAGTLGRPFGQLTPLQPHFEGPLLEGIPQLGAKAPGRPGREDRPVPWSFRPFHIRGGAPEPARSTGARAERPTRS